MSRSMTGYGRDISIYQDKEYLVEIKSVNYKYSDITVRLPKQLSFLEDNIRKTVASKIMRGKIDVFVSYKSITNENPDIKINKNIIKAYIQEYKEIAKELQIEYDIKMSHLLNLPDIMIEIEENEEELTNGVMISIHNALDSLMESKKIEGEQLKKDILSRITNIQQKIEEVIQKSSGLLQEYVIKLKSRIRTMLATDVNEDRILQEIVLFADKSSIEEELTRLHSHIKQLKITLDKEESIGKNLDFIIQEINREVNTICSKANCIDITNHMVYIKNEVENIREQVQNIE